MTSSEGMVTRLAGRGPFGGLQRRAGARGTVVESIATTQSRLPSASVWASRAVDTLIGTGLGVSECGLL
ncbi:hypothetical protein ADK34_17780 [Streptomyces viridochromogenes]|uniref:Uncharacterized protein n=1 Tax=Streptomyces viridochromogenes TaxID=1938 RepID=A0A0L8KHG8_STRVR|nr:hypothetical protein ADK34_17780 [Streptomyces viridochromogenes]